MSEDTEKTLRQNIKRILYAVADQGICKGQNCQRHIFWIKNKVTGKAMPLDDDGTPHWATCPDAPAFKHQNG